MSFWASGTGEKVTGRPEEAFSPSFAVIPDGTTAVATIKAFEVVSKTSEYRGDEAYYQITWKIVSDDFKGREVTQKIKALQGKPASIQRALNMLKLVMDLCNYTPTHGDAPGSEDLSHMVGRVMGIKILEWSLPKDDGTLMEGNFVSEVVASAGFAPEVGVKAVVVARPVETAFSRNPKVRLDEDLPF